MNSASRLSRDAALLEFAVRRGSVPLATPLKLGGTPTAGCSLRQGKVYNASEKPVGTVQFTREGMTLVGTEGQVLAQLDRYGLGQEGVALAHPVHGASWASLVSEARGGSPAARAPASAPVSPAPVRASAASTSDVSEDAPRSGNGPKIAMVAGVAVLVAAAAFFALSGGSSEETHPAADPPAVASAPAAAPSGAEGARPTAPAATAPPAVPTTPATASESAAAPATTAAAATPSAVPSAQGHAMPQAATKAAPAAAPAPVAPTLPKASAGSVVVGQGQTLSRLARAQGITSEANLSGWIEACMRLNGLTDANRLEPGQTLQLPPNPPPPWQGDLYSEARYPGR